MILRFLYLGFKPTLRFRPWDLRFLLKSGALWHDCMQTSATLHHTSSRDYFYIVAFRTLPSSSVSRSFTVQLVSASKDHNSHDRPHQVRQPRRRPNSMNSCRVTSSTFASARAKQFKSWAWPTRQPDSIKQLSSGPRAPEKPMTSWTEFGCDLMDYQYASCSTRTPCSRATSTTCSPPSMCTLTSVQLRLTGSLAWWKDGMLCCDPSWSASSVTTAPPAPTTLTV